MKMKLYQAILLCGGIVLLCSIAFAAPVEEPAAATPATETAAPAPRPYPFDADPAKATPKTDAPLASVVKGQPGGIAVGAYAPDFQLEPIGPHSDFTVWLGENAPKTIEDTVRLSDLTGKAPIILLFGSYT
jgi:hypothetical protein